MSLTAGKAILLSSAAGGGYQISRSLRFNSADSAYLSRTPASAGNRKTWTWAGWVKRCSSSAGGTQGLFLAGANPDRWTIQILEDVLYVGGSLGGVDRNISWVGVLRDFSAWYHIVVACDTTQSVSTDRFKVYLNGTQITTYGNSSGIPAQNTDLPINNTVAHQIGNDNASGGRYLNGYLADIYFIDGQALTPSSFTEVSSTTGQLIPKAYTGTFGTNGFWLKFSDNSASTATTLGKDYSGNNNNWTPNNITAGPGTTSNSWSGYFDGSGDSLTVTNSAAYDFGSGNFTIEGWAFPSTSSQLAFAARAQNTGFEGWILSTTNFLATTTGSSWDVSITFTSALTASAWNHVAIVRNGNVYTAYLNGVANGTTTVSGSIVAGSAVAIIGQRSGQTDFNGYISNFRIVKGTAVYTAAFTPPTTPLTAITNTSLLTLQSSTFVDNSSNNFTITAVGNTRVDIRSPFEEPSDTDSFVDTPTSYGSDTGIGSEVRGNYCILNFLDKGNVMSLSNGNLYSTSSAANHNLTRGTIGVSTGKWYWEVTATNKNNDNIGVANRTIAVNGAVLANPGDANSAGIYTADFNNGSILGFALDCDSGKLFISENGTWKNSGNPVTGTNPWTATLTSGPYFPAANLYNFSGADPAYTWNFGQRSWAYTAPTGYKALCDTNLTAPIIAKPSTVMDIALYTGNGSTQTISGFNFEPDFVWLKGRSVAYSHQLYDQIRGAGKLLNSNTTNAESTVTDNLTAFTSSGFTLGNDAGTNQSSATYVAWTWDAGSSTVTNTQGSITTSLRASASSGFSVISYTGTGSAGASIGHGLGVAPAFALFKNRSTSSDWQVYHVSLGNAQSILLQSTAAAGSSSAFNSTSPTSTVITLGAGTSLNNNGSSHICYAWAPVAGYSSFGSYTGNGSADGPFIFTEFRPKWLMIKLSSSAGEDWLIKDATRSSYNVMDNNLYADLSNAEQTGNASRYLDFLSNGFKWRGSDTGVNANGQTYIYAAFAENPFQYARAR